MSASAMSSSASASAIGRKCRPDSKPDWIFRYHQDTPKIDELAPVLQNHCGPRLEHINHFSPVGILGDMRHLIGQGISVSQQRLNLGIGGAVIGKLHVNLRNLSFDPLLL